MSFWQFVWTRRYRKSLGWTPTVALLQFPSVVNLPYSLLCLCSVLGHTSNAQPEDLDVLHIHSQEKKETNGCMEMLQGLSLKKTRPWLKKSLRDVYLHNPLTMEVNGAYS